MRWIDVGLVPGSPVSLTRPSEHWIYPVADHGVIHLRHLPGLWGPYGAYGPWEVTWERKDGAVLVLALDISVVHAQTMAEDVIAAACWGEWTAYVINGDAHNALPQHESGRVLEGEL